MLEAGLLLLQVEGDLRVRDFAPEWPDQEPDGRDEEREPGKHAQGDDGVCVEPGAFEPDHGEEGHASGESYDPHQTSKSETHAPPPADATHDVADPILNLTLF